MRALFIGFGNVGRRVASLLTRERHRFPGLQGLDIKPVGIVTRSRGALVNPGGVDFEEALSAIERQGKLHGDSPAYTETAAIDAAKSLDYDVLVELSTLSIENRGEPAISHISAALWRGRHAVSANKGPVAFAFRELASLAHERQCRFLFETAVMDGAPVFNLARCALKGCAVTGIEGILNSTTNYVITRMEEGASLEAAVREAQDKGVAEADPSHDLEGWDAAAKTAALANVLMDAGITPFDVERSGITGLKSRDVMGAVEQGRRLKLLCSVKREGAAVKAAVGVKEMPEGHHFAAVKGGGAILRIETDLMGPILVVQEAPTLYDTAYGVLDDLLTLQRSMC